MINSHPTTSKPAKQEQEKSWSGLSVKVKNLIKKILNEKIMFALKIFQNILTGNDIKLKPSLSII